MNINKKTRIIIVVILAFIAGLLAFYRVQMSADTTVISGSSKHGHYVSVEIEDQLIDAVLSRFWGRAVDSKGRPIMPENELEKATLPIPRNIAYGVLNVGFDTGLGEWCGVPWEERFHLFMKRMRTQFHTEKEIAFVGVLHGTGQGFMQKQKNSANEPQECDAEMRQNMQTLFAIDEKKWK